MNRRAIFAITGAAVFVAALSASALAEATLKLKLEGMDPHVGQPFFLRVIDAESREEVFRVTLAEIGAAAFDIDVAGLEAGHAYRVDFFADMNGNGVYDAPPADHAWRIDLPALQGDKFVSFAHTVAFTDIDWPPEIDGRIEEDEYRNAFLNAATGMSVFWQNDDETLYVGLESPGTGWLAIGFGPQRMMQGANIVIGAVVDGVLTVEDHYGDAPTSHRRDAVDHILQAAGREADGRSVLEFAIPLDSGDPQDVALQPGSEVTIILAYHRSNDGLTTVHSERSAASLRLDE